MNTFAGQPWPWTAAGMIPAIRVTRHRFAGWLNWLWRDYWRKA